MIADEVEFKIFGQDSQFVEIELDPGETVIAESGALLYTRGDIHMETVFGDPNKSEDGLLSKLFAAGKRVITGENLFATAFQAGNRSRKSYVAFAAPFPGQILPLDLAELGVIHCQKKSFLCAAKGVQTEIALTKHLGSGFFGGEGFILQKLEGEGLAFIHCGGALHPIDLEPDEMIKIDTGCMAAFQASMEFNIEFVGNIKSALFGGEGLFFATLKGPGKCWIQSLPFSRFAASVIQAGKGVKKGEAHGGPMGGSTPEKGSGFMEKLGSTLFKP